MSSECETLPAGPEEDTTIPETTCDLTEADTLRWVPIATRVDLGPPDTRRYGSGG